MINSDVIKLSNYPYQCNYTERIEYADWMQLNFDLLCGKCLKVFEKVQFLLLNFECEGSSEARSSDRASRSAGNFWRIGLSDE